jgi:hypothetical protein
MDSGDSTERFEAPVTRIESGSLTVPNQHESRLAREEIA